MVASENKQKNPKFKTFLFFLGLAILLWFLTKFSKETRALVTLDLTYINIPEASILSEKNPNEISMSLVSNGFEILLYALKDAHLNVDLSKYRVDSNHQIHISSSELETLVKNQLNVSSTGNYSLNELIVLLDKSIQKKIPAVFDGEITFKDGFRSLNHLLLTPDSITVSGPSELIETIDSMPTQKLTLRDIENSVSKSLKLKAPLDSKISWSPREVTLQLDVEEFTQKSLVIPIELINLPEGLSVQLIPNEIRVNFEVSLSNFNNINASNFRLVCDFSEKITEGNFMIPKMVYQPKEIFRAELETKKVEYLIFK